MSEPEEGDQDGIDAGIRNAFRRSAKGPPAEKPAAPDADFAGRYTLGPEIGRGGMGIVRRAFDLVLGRHIALKLLRPEFAASVDRCRRFVEEARIASRLEHPGIVPVYDRGVTEEGELFFTMKLVAGETLKQRLRAIGPVAPARRQLLPVVARVAEAMAAAHAAGVVHRDLKPSNIMLGQFGEVLVMDFGLAKLLPEGGESPALESPSSAVSATTASGHATQSDHVLGTPTYMAPEQALGRASSLGPPADVFALGAILHEVLVGEPPRRDPASLDHAPVPVDLEREGIERPLRDLVHACLEVEPDRRPAHAGIVAERLTAYLASLTEAKAAAERALAIQAAKVGAERRARRLTVAFLSLLLAATVGGAAYWILRTEAESEERRRVDAVATQAAQRAEATLARAEARLLIGSARESVAAAEGVVIAVQPALVSAELKEAAMRLQASAKAVLAAAESAEALLQRDLALVAALDALRAEMLTQRDAIGLTRKIEAAYRAWGIDLEADSREDLIARVTHSPLRGTAIDGLHRYWAACTAARKSGERNAVWVLRLIRDLETDPPLREFLDLRLARDLDGVIQWMRVADLHPIAPLALALTANSIRGEGRKRDAIDILIRIVDVHPGSADAQVKLGIAAQDGGTKEDLARAIRALEAAEVLIPDLPFPRGLRIMILARTGARDEALRIFAATASDLRRHPMMLDAQALLLILNNQREEAIPILREVMTLDPGNLDAAARLGIILCARREHEEAEPLLRKALAVQSRNPVLLALGQLLHDEQAWLESEAVLRELCFGWPESADYWLRMGDVLSRHGNYPAALEALRRAETAKNPPGVEWKVPVRDKIAECEEMLAQVEIRLRALLDQGEIPPLRVWMAMAALCRDRAAFDEELQVYRAGFAEYPELAPQLGLRACEAALLHANKPETSASAKVELHREARGWLEGSLRRFEDDQDGSPPSIRVRSDLGFILRSSAMAPVRDEAALTMLSEAEATAWRAVWERLRRVLAVRSEIR